MCGKNNFKYFPLTLPNTLLIKGKFILQRSFTIFSVNQSVRPFGTDSSSSYIWIMSKIYNFYHKVLNFELENPKNINIMW